MAECTMCSSWVPNGQKVCSMCYGDSEYGNDGYYQESLRQQEEYEERLSELEQMIEDRNL